MANFEMELPKEISKFGSLNEQEISKIFSESMEERELWYARMLDRYHEIYTLERELIAKNADDAEIRPINFDRDRLHKQIERFGRDFGKTKEIVLADIIAREGNLGEFLLPEYGLLMPDQILNERECGVPGVIDEEFRRANFVFSGSAEKAHSLSRHIHKENSENPSGIPRWNKEIPGIGERSVVSGLLPDEVLVVFGTMFNEDIKGASIEIEPPGFPEKFRRAARAVDALREQGIEADIFFKRLSIFHDATTVIGITILAKNLESHGVKLLRNSKDLYGIRPNDLPTEIVDLEYQNHTQGNIYAFRKWDLWQMFSEVFEQEREIIAKDFFESEKYEKAPLYLPTIDMQMEIVLDTYPKFQEEKEALRKFLVRYQERIRENFLQPFQEIHKKYFGV